MGEDPSGTGLGCALPNPTDIPVHLLLAKLAAPVLPMEAKTRWDKSRGQVLAWVSGAFHFWF